MKRGTQEGRCAWPRAALLIAALSGPLAPGVRAGSHCPDPGQTNFIGGPGGELRAAAELASWAPGEPFTAPTSATVDDTTQFGGIFHAEMAASGGLSFGYPIVVTFALAGEQGVSINGARSRLDWPLDLDLPGLAPGQPLVLDYELEVTAALDEGSGTRAVTLALENSTPAAAQQTVGPLAATGEQAVGLFTGAVHPTLPEFRLRLAADAHVLAPSGRQEISGTLRVILRTTGDFDGDGLVDTVEIDGADGVPGTGDESDPGLFDADRDGESDAAEVARAGNPFDPCNVEAAGAEANCLEVGDVVSWRAIAGCGVQTVTYDLYRGRLDVLHAGGPYTQPGETTGVSFCDLTALSQADAATPLVGEPLYWLVTAARDGIDLTLGFDSDGQVRPNANPCP